MSSTSKPMPVLPKILIGLAVLGVIYSVSVRHHPSYEQRSSFVTSSPSPDEERRPEPRAANGANQQVAQYLSQIAQIKAQMDQCNAQNDAFAQQMANGMATVEQYPACNQNNAQWIPQIALLYTYVARLQTGNPNLTVCEANIGLRGCESMYAPASASSSSSSSSSSDDTSATVERASRQGILGQTIYTDGDGRQYQLPTRDYYYRDRVTGETLGSNSSSPPNGVHEYEQLRPER
jgi:hypothetical protein